MEGSLLPLLTTTHDAAECTSCGITQKCYTSLRNLKQSQQLIAVNIISVHLCRHAWVDHAKGDISTPDE